VVAPVPVVGIGAYVPVGPVLPLHVELYDATRVVDPVERGLRLCGGTS